VRASTAAGIGAEPLASKFSDYATLRLIVAIWRLSVATYIGPLYWL